MPHFSYLNKVYSQENDKLYKIPEIVPCIQQQQKTGEFLRCQPPFTETNPAESLGQWLEAFWW